MTNAWICPRCNRVNAPFMFQCFCSSSIRTVKTSVTSPDQLNTCPHGIWCAIECIKCSENKKVDNNG